MYLFSIFCLVTMTISLAMEPENSSESIQYGKKKVVVIRDANGLISFPNEKINQEKEKFTANIRDALMQAEIESTTLDGVFECHLN